jgi:hypothetical protein
MPRHPLFRLLPLSAALLGAGCDSEPKLDVKVAKTPAVAAQPAHTAAPAGATGPAGTVAGERAAPPITAGSQMPAGHPAIGASSGVAAGSVPIPIVAAGGEGGKAIVWTVPAGWKAEPPANQTRRAQYRVPGPGGDGECAVFYFGPGQGGDPASNAERWASQFEQPNGKPAAAAMRTRNLRVGEMKVLIVETTGTYLAGGTMGGPVERRPGWALLGAVVEGPDANWFFKLTGPKVSLDAQRAAFEGMVKSVKRPG